MNNNSITELREICKEIAYIIEEMYCGQIEFVYDDLMSAMKPGHPSDILDDILSIIGWDVFAGKTPEKEKVEQTLDELTQFSNGFKVKELKKPISNLKKYLKSIKDEQ